MIIKTFNANIQTNGRDDCVDLTERVQEAVKTSGIAEGLATIFVPGSTAAVTTVEYEAGVIQDLKEALRRFFPETQRYAHHDTAAGDNNGFSHLRAAFIGPSLTIPIVAGQLQLGNWQQIVLIDFDIRPRSRAYTIHLLGQ